MNTENLILLETVCSYYKVELYFFTQLSEMGLIEIEIIEQSPYIHKDQIKDIERIVRMHHELELNPEGIDVVFNLLQKIDHLQKDLITTKNRLRLYES
ncbi:chaperone modulator CbpM [Flavobacterium aestivum]|uniref:chaperone modulator CbpM n=1 Tax=Flavobacterium aestivum TaxID=3003257 RepID=UPI0022854B43|nr:chaperone modulator CbpM [Flavobacterium aestivum]